MLSHSLNNDLVATIKECDYLQLQYLSEKHSVDHNTVISIHSTLQQHHLINHTNVGIYKRGIGFYTKQKDPTITRRIYTEYIYDFTKTIATLALEYHTSPMTLLQLILIEFFDLNMNKDKKIIASLMQTPAYLYLLQIPTKTIEQYNINNIIIPESWHNLYSHLPHTPQTHINTLSKHSISITSQYDHSNEYNNIYNDILEIPHYFSTITTTTQFRDFIIYYHVLSRMFQDITYTLYSNIDVMHNNTSIYINRIKSRIGIDYEYILQYYLQSLKSIPFLNDLQLRTLAKHKTPDILFLLPLSLGSSYLRWIDSKMLYLPGTNQNDTHNTTANNITHDNENGLTLSNSVNDQLAKQLQGYLHRFQHGAALFWGGMDISNSNFLSGSVLSHNNLILSHGTNYIQSNHDPQNPPLKSSTPSAYSELCTDIDTILMYNISTNEVHMNTRKTHPDFCFGDGNFIPHHSQDNNTIPFSTLLHGNSLCDGFIPFSQTVEINGVNTPHSSLGRCYCGLGNTLQFILQTNHFIEHHYSLGQSSPALFSDLLQHEISSPPKNTPDIMFNPAGWTIPPSVDDHVLMNDETEESDQSMIMSLLSMIDKEYHDVVIHGNGYSQDPLASTLINHINNNSTYSPAHAPSHNNHTEQSISMDTTQNTSKSTHTENNDEYKHIFRVFDRFAYPTEFSTIIHNLSTLPHITHEGTTQTDEKLQSVNDSGFNGQLDDLIISSLYQQHCDYSELFYTSQIHHMMNIHPPTSDDIVNTQNFPQKVRPISTYLIPFDYCDDDYDDIDTELPHSTNIHKKISNLPTKSSATSLISQSNNAFQTDIITVVLPTDESITDLFTPPKNESTTINNLTLYNSSSNNNNNNNSFNRRRKHGDDNLFQMGKVDSKIFTPTPQPQTQSQQPRSTSFSESLFSQTSVSTKNNLFPSATPSNSHMTQQNSSKLFSPPKADPSPRDKSVVDDHISPTNNVKTKPKPPTTSIPKQQYQQPQGLWGEKPAGVWGTKPPTTATPISSTISKPSQKIAWGSLSKTDNALPPNLSVTSNTREKNESSNIHTGDGGFSRHKIAPKDKFNYNNLTNSTNNSNNNNNNINNNGVFIPTVKKKH